MNIKANFVRNAKHHGFSVESLTKQPKLQMQDLKNPV